MKNYEYHSQLAPYISGLIRQKQAAGYSYEFEAYMLERFDRFCIERGHSDGNLTRELVMDWARQTPTESKNYRNQRVSFVRQLGLYMLSIDENAYLPPTLESNAVAAPYILSSDELREFFCSVDRFVPQQSRFRRCALSYSVLFRLFYCCGLRLSEGCHLRVSAVNLDSGILSIYHSKGEHDRLVFMADDLLQMCKNYDRRMQTFLPNREWFFPGRDGSKPLSKTAIDKRFSQFWAMTSYAGKTSSDTHPTVHSLRHTYVVMKINEWMAQGEDFQTLMPYLSRYLGHTSIDETHYYFHIVVSAFDTVRKHDLATATVIPEVIPYEE